MCILFWFDSLMCYKVDKSLSISLKWRSLIFHFLFQNFHVITSRHTRQLCASTRKLIPSHEKSASKRKVKIHFIYPICRRINHVKGDVDDDDDDDESVWNGLRQSNVFFLSHWEKKTLYLGELKIHINV